MPSILNLVKQIVTCISLSLLIITFLVLAIPFFYFISFIFILIIPIIVFYVVFSQENNKGSEFKIMRFFIAAVLWVGFWSESYTYGGYVSKLKDILRHAYGYDNSWPWIISYPIYTAIAIAIVVILSYIIGKLIHKWVRDENTDEINEEQE